MFDIHSHVLPGIDDGAKSLEMAVELCRQAEAEGVTAIAATPHIRDGVWDNRRPRIEERIADLREALRKQGSAIEVVLGAEVFYATGILDAVREGAYPTYGDGKRYFLLELPSFFILRQVQSLIFEFRTAGYTPVLAHPERNAQLMSSLEGLEELVRMGVLFQVTAMSLTGRFGRGARKAADSLLDRGLVHVVASDAHHPQFRPALMREARARVAARCGEDRARLLLEDNPRAILTGGDAEGGVLEVPERRGLRGLLGRVFASCEAARAGAAGAGAGYFAATRT